jgi:hypothetical protein
VEASTLCGLLLDAELIGCLKKKGFEILPGLRLLAVPKFALVEIEPCVEDKGKGSVDDLLRRVGLVAGVGIFDRCLDLVNQRFEGSVGIPRVSLSLSSGGVMLP